MLKVVYYRDFNYSLLLGGLFVYKEGENNDTPTYSEVINDQSKTPLLKHTSLIKKVREMLIAERNKYPESEQKSKYFPEMTKEKVRNKIINIGFGVLKEEKNNEAEKAKKAEETAYKISKDSDKIGLQNAELRDMATKDGLTKIYNRGFLMELGEKITNETKREIRNQNNEGGNLGALMIDIDFFKRINDNFGHQIGDSAIIFVAKTIENNINRGGDVLGRYGGEEFLLFLPKTDINGAIAVGEKLKNVIKFGLKNLIEDKLRRKTTGYELVKKLKILKEEISGTISIGISCLNKDNYVDSEELIDQADIALYMAKNKGRNQVIASELTEKRNDIPAIDNEIIERKDSIKITPEKAIEA